MMAVLCCEVKAMYLALLSSWESTVMVGSAAERMQMGSGIKSCRWERQRQGTQVTSGRLEMEGLAQESEKDQCSTRIT